jgi:outer membrane biosynthesis protein TonB
MLRRFCMKLLLLAMMVLGSVHALIAQTEAPEEKPPFQPAETLSVTDIPALNSCVAIGTVVLDVLITDTGEVQKVEVRRDIACLTQLAVHAVEDWEFSPATLEGKAIASRVPVAVTFRPPSPFADPVPFPALIPQSEAAIQAEFQPAEVIHAEFPKYTVSTFAAGAVVLEVTLNEKGEAGEAKVLRDLPPFTEEAKAVVGEWRFMPAAYNGKPVPSKIVLAIVSPPPASTPLL